MTKAVIPTGSSSTSIKRLPRPTGRDVPGMDDSELVVYMAHWEPLHAVAKTLHWWQPGDCGRKPDVPPAMLALFGVIAFGRRGDRGAERLFRSRFVWEAVRAPMEQRYPGYAGLQLGAASVSRSEFWRYLETYGIDPSIFAGLLDEFTVQAAEQATAMGMFDPHAGSTTHPARQNTLVGDGTVLRPRYEAALGDTQWNTLTGQDEQKPYDPDAAEFETGGKKIVTDEKKGLAKPKKGVTGTKFGFVESILPKFMERLILSVFNVPAGKGHSEADEALKAIARIFELLPAAQAVAWDKALRGVHIDWLYQHGKQPVVKTAMAPGGKEKQRLVGVYQVQRMDGSTEDVQLYALNGAPCILAIVDGKEHLIRCERGQIRRRQNAGGGFRWYVDLVIPDDPRVKPALRRGAIPLVRLDTTDEDRKKRFNRAENLRAISEGDDDWDRLYAPRPTSESINRWVKERFRDNRAPAVGVPRQHIRLVFAALYNNFRAWVAHCGREGIPLPGAPPGSTVAP